MNKITTKIKSLKCLTRYEITYLEMKHRLKQILKGKKKNSYKIIDNSDRNIGKSVALARLSVKYNIPIVVPYHSWEYRFKYDIPKYVPKHFEDKRPKVITINENSRGRKFDVLLIEEGLTNKQFYIANELCNGKMVGYININNIY